jgi:PAS domain S-box-containing protein
MTEDHGKAREQLIDELDALRRQAGEWVEAEKKQQRAFDCEKALGRMRDHLLSVRSLEDFDRADILGEMREGLIELGILIHSRISLQRPVTRPGYYWTVYNLRIEKKYEQDLTICPWVEEVWETGKPVVVTGERLGAYTSELAELLEVPLSGWGSLGLNSLEEGTFDPEAIRTIESFAGIIAEVLPRIEVLEALRESEGKYRQLIELAQEGIWVIDQEANTTFVNPSMARMLGLTVEEMEGRSLFSFMDEGGKALAEENIRRREQGIAEQHDFEFLRKDGSRIYAALATSPIVDREGNYVGAIAGVIDMTERKRMEQELARTQRLRALNEMAGGVSHNLNNMLVSVLGPALLLKRATKDLRVLREVEEIITSAKRARDLVQRLNQAVRGEQEGELYPVSLNEVIEQVVHSTQPRWKDQSEAKGIAIDVAMELEEVRPIRGNLSELNDILLNLLFNAVDAMPEGGRLTFRTRASGEGVRLEVADTGIGMEEETRRKVFEPFFTTKMDIGTGLGLTTVLGTMTRWGGSIEVSSAPGQGTTFVLQFSAMDEARSCPEESAVEDRQVRSGRVLIVEDDEAIGALLCRLLGETHSVETVSDGRAALERFAPGSYDVALIDLGMPGVPGDRIGAQMKQIDPAVATVLMTGWDLSPDDEKVASFDFRIQKPFDDLDEVENIVARGVLLHDERAEGQEG